VSSPWIAPRGAATAARFTFEGKRRLTGWYAEDKSSDRGLPGWMYVMMSFFSLVVVGIGAFTHAPPAYTATGAVILAGFLVHWRVSRIRFNLVGTPRQQVRLDDEGLWVNGSLQGPRARIGSIEPAQREDGHFVVRVRGDYDMFVEIVADSLDEAIALSRIYDAVQPASYRLRGGGRLVVGSDGLHVEGGTSEWIPMGDVVDHSVRGDALVVETSHGERVLRIGGERGAANFAALELRDLRDAYRATHAFAEGLGKAPDRRAWQARLTGESDGYREQAPGEDMLWQIVETPSADPNARAAAALLLRKESESATERLRIAASACAAPRLRFALSSAASGGEAAVDASLAESEDEAAREAGRAVG